MRKKVLVIYEEVSSYRVDIFDILLKDYDITVAYTNPKYKGKDYNFKTLFIPRFQLGPFGIHSRNLYRIASQYDVVIGLFDVRMLSIMRLSMVRKRKYKLIYWGIGVTASYQNRFDSKQTWDFVRFFFGKRADALMFYTPYPIERFSKKGFEESRLFVANNTVAVDFKDDGLPEQKTDFLFIGTLYKEKGISILIDSYLRLADRLAEVPKLHIIGGGPMESELAAMVKEKGMTDQILVHGPIYDKEILSSYFQKSIVCISPDQAGLSILNSMGHGVPYLTHKNAFTGGEILNIEDKKTGMLYEGGVEELAETLLWVINNRKEVLQMGNKALEFYNACRRPEHMAQSVSDAISYVLGTE